MCGIAGVVRTRGGRPIQRTVVDAMTDAMTHRGPDGRGIWASDDGLAVLGHRRLAIVDLSNAGRQPMGNADGTIQVTFNGEIYNFRQLRSELEAKGHCFRSQSDTEVLVYLYQEYGEEMLHHLSGDFGFAIWDAREKRLLLARDRMGVKPVYYSIGDEHFAFASETRALLQHPSIHADIDDEALYHYLTYLAVPAPKTLLRGVLKLPAGGVLSLQVRGDGFQVRTWQFWKPFPRKTRIHDGDLDERLSHLFERSVQKRLMSDVPVGVLFSGGVDSTLNAASFQERIYPQKVKTYNVGVQGANWARSESEFALEMAKTLGTEHHVVNITEEDLLNSIRLIAQHQDEPLADPVCVPLYFVTKLARDTGTIVLHAGEGADETFCGYNNYRRFIRHHQTLWRPLKYVPSSLTRLGSRLLQHASSPKMKKVADILRRHSRGQQFFMSSAVAYYEIEKEGILSPEYSALCQRYDAHDAVAPLYKDIDDNCPDATFLEKITFIEMQLRLPELLLMRVDKMSMANSVEVRVPFLDDELVDFALSVPESFKLRNGVSKEPIKRLAARYVARDQIYRPKTGFGAPIQEWFRSSLGEEMREELRSDVAGVAGYFNQPELIRRLEQGPRSVNEAFQLWVIFNLMKWRQSTLSPQSGVAA